MALDSRCLEMLGERLYGLASHEHSTFGFEHAERSVPKSKLRVALPYFRRIQLFAPGVQLLQQIPHSQNVWIVVIAEPKDSCAMKQIAAGSFKKVPPQRKGTHGPMRVEFIAPVAQAHDAGLAPRTGATVPCSIRIEQNDARARVA